MIEPVMTMNDPRVIAEAANKRAQVQTWLEQKGLDGVILSRRNSFAWVTCGGDNKVSNYTEVGAGHIVITRNKHYLVAYYMDAERLLNEQVAEQGYELVPLHWFDGDERGRAKALAGKQPGADTLFPGTQFVLEDIMDMQWPLSDLELERTRWLGRQENEILHKIFTLVQPGMTELEIGQMLTCEIVHRGLEVDVPIVGSDERIHKYRHVLATDKKLERYLLLGPVIRRWGLHAMVSRSLHFGEPPADVQKAFMAAATIEGRIITSLKEGLKFKTILEHQKAWYEELGIERGWTYHFQGGPIGYTLVDAGRNQTEKVVQAPQPFSWWTTVKGAKVEELTILTKDGPEIASLDNGWPLETVDTEAGPIAVPGMMIR